MTKSLLSVKSSHLSSMMEEEMTVDEYLNLCKKDPTAYASPAERMVKAIGEPELVDTSRDPRLGKIFSNRKIRRYAAFKDFYGIEETVERLVDYFKHASQNLEESKQILYLLGGVGGSKSTLAEKLKQLMESQPFYAIKGSPVNDSPLCLYTAEEHGDDLLESYGIPIHRLIYKPSPWLLKRVAEAKGDLSWIKVVKRYPSRNHQVAISRTEPGDENNQDISALVGKIDIRKLESFAPNDPDAYSYSGGLCLANRGVLEFVEMFKAPIKVLHPLLSATQDRMFNGTEAISSIPFEGIILAHSNESEWNTFRNDKKNEAFIDRVYIVKVPYCLRITEEIDIYKKLLRQSTLSQAPCAPKTLELLATFTVVSRLHAKSDEDIQIKSKIYNGEDVKAKVNNPKSMQVYKDEAGIGEGMRGISPRFGFKVLSKTFNFDPEEIAACPIHLFEVLRHSVEQEDLPPERTQSLLDSIVSILEPEYDEHLCNEIQTAYVDSYSEYGQNLFDKYILYADSWLQENEFRDHETGMVMDRERLHKELQELEQPASINNYADFRNEVVRFVLAARNKNNGNNPKWTDYEKIRIVIQKKLFLNQDEILPIISFDVKKSDSDAKKHRDFVKRMIEKGYTEKQVRLVTSYYVAQRYRKK